TGLQTPMRFKPPNFRRLQGAADVRRRARRRTFVLQAPENKADAVPCERLQLGGLKRIGVCTPVDGYNGGVYIRHGEEVFVFFAITERRKALELFMPLRGHLISTVKVSSGFEASH
ncbi:MAG: hypothetical protein WBN03_19890, partial [Desulfobacterales bacterium]